MPIRDAFSGDLAFMLAMSEAKRAEYERYAPVFWRAAANAKASQAPFFLSELENPDRIVLIAENGGVPVGFVMAAVVDPPPVYDPGGKVCVIDDFAVASPDLWPTVGRSLLLEAFNRSKIKGAALCVVVCAALDSDKRESLQSAGLDLASEWYAGTVS